ncbi:MAG: hypothetical protein ABI630_07370 [Betaproteobacteria bacterium]
MKLRSLAVASLALVVAVAPALAAAAGPAGHGGGHRHSAPRVSIGIGVGVGGMWNPYYDPFYDPFYDPYWDYGYPPNAYGYVAPPPVPCTPADVPTKEPSTNIFSPDYSYDRIDAARCAPQVAGQEPVPATAPAPAAVQPPPAYYFCRSANAYYPQVAQCAEGWQQVAPKPPGM